METSTCEPWATEDDIPSDCTVDGDDSDARITEALQIASDVLFELSARQYRGVCEDIVRPYCRRCQNSRTCSHTLQQVGLGSYPVREIVEVLVDGAVLDPAFYRVDEYRWLVRLPDADGDRVSWPTWQRLDLEATEPDTFQVTLLHGTAPPLAGRRAAAVFGCELAKAFGGGDCKLPKRVQNISRQGVTIGAILDAFTQLDKGRTGIFEVDLFLATYNRGGQRRRPAVVTPDIPRTIKRLGSDPASS